MRRHILFCALALLAMPMMCAGQAHFAPGVADIRDYSMPQPGVYVAVYNYDYRSSTVADSNGNSINQILVGNTPINVSFNVNVYALSPMLLWVPNFSFLGGHYGAYIAPSFSNANIGALISTLNGAGINPHASDFAAGDLFVDPLWLGWSSPHFDATAGYGFYAPIGKFNTQTFNLPSGPRVVTSPTNVGLGYWTNQIEGNVMWYPSVKRGTAIANTITAEFNGEQRHTNVTNGNFLTWNWGLSQYVPLDKKLHYLTELGVMGYSQWQVSDSSGPNVNPSKREQMNGIGFQAGIISTGLGLQLNFLYYNEFGGANRLRGSSYSLNLLYTIEKAKQAPAP